jgi:hypothetical protein
MPADSNRRPERPRDHLGGRSRRAATDRVTLAAITPREWRAVLRAARELDLNHGGYWDGRSGAVNAWCGPDDKPAGWPAEVEITRGALAHPRSFVASCWLQWPDDGPVDWDTDQALPVVAHITVYDVRDWQQRRRRTDPDQRVTGRARGDVAWLKRHWRELLALARSRLPRPLRLELGQTDGSCLRCGGPLRRIERVLSSPWADGPPSGPADPLGNPDGIGDWRHWCPVCQVLTVPAGELLAGMATGRAGVDGPESGAVGRVFAVGPVVEAQP